MRLSSLHPGDIDECLLEALGRHENCVAHFHLPLQSGSPDILRRMNRQYTVEKYVEMIDELGARFDRPAITTDIIVGFPGESEADFEETLEIARHSRFCKIHAFRFSPRPGTAAARWTTQFVHHQTVKDRMGRLRDLERELAADYRRQFIGEPARVLVEAAPDGEGLARGRVDRYFEVCFQAEACRPGDLVTVRIDRADAQRVDAVQV